MSDKVTKVTPRVWKARVFSGEGYDQYGKPREGRHYCNFDEAIKLEIELIEARERIKKLEKLLDKAK